MKIPYRSPWLIGALIILLSGGGWWFFGRPKTTTTAAVTEAAAEGTLVQTVSASGSLTANVSAKISATDYGQIAALYVKNGDEVKADQALMKFHSLASGADKAKALASLLSSQDSVNQALNKVTTLNQSLTSAQQQLNDAQKNEKIAGMTTQSANLAYAKSKIDATKAQKDAAQDIISAAQTQDKAVGDLGIVSAQIGNDSATLSADSAKLGGNQSVISAANSLAQAQRDQASAKLKTQAAQLALNATQNNLANQPTSIAASKASLTASQLNYQLLTDQVVTSPIAGRVVNLSASVDSTIGNQTSSVSGSSSSSSSAAEVFSIIDFSSIRADVSVSEVDIAKLQIGQPATLTFDALPGQTFTGTVSNVNAIGTTTQGVTNYDVEIKLDNLPDSLKPGMNLDASIITSKKEHALLVPNSAVSAQGTQNIVEVVRHGVTETVNVTVGDSNGSQTEILSGLTAGDQVVTIPSSSSSNTTSAFSGRGGLFGGGGGVRELGR